MGSFIDFQIDNIVEQEASVGLEFIGLTTFRERHLFQLKNLHLLRERALACGCHRSVSSGSLLGPPGPVSENPASSSDADTNFPVHLFTHASPECDLRTPDGWGRRFEQK